MDTYRRIGHAPSHWVSHLFGHSISWGVSTAEAVGARNGRPERFGVYHHFVMGVHHSVHSSTLLSFFVKPTNYFKLEFCFDFFLLSFFLKQNQQSHWNTENKKVWVIRLSRLECWRFFHTRRHLSWAMSCSCRRHNFTSWEVVYSVVYNAGEPMDFRRPSEPKSYPV